MAENDGDQVHINRKQNADNDSSVRNKDDHSVRVSSKRKLVDNSVHRDDHSVHIDARSIHANDHSVRVDDHSTTIGTAGWAMVATVAVVVVGFVAVSETGQKWVGIGNATVTTPPVAVTCTNLSTFASGASAAASWLGVRLTPNSAKPGWFHVAFDLERPAFVYLVNINESGEQQLLYPNPCAPAGRSDVGTHALDMTCLVQPGYEFDGVQSNINSKESIIAVASVSDLDSTNELRTQSTASTPFPNIPFLGKKLCSAINNLPAGDYAVASARFP